MTQKNISMIIKIAFTIIIFILLWLIFRKEDGLDEILDEIILDATIPAPQGEFMRIEEVLIITHALNNEIGNEPLFYQLTEKIKLNPNAVLTYADYRELMTLLNLIDHDRYIEKYQPEHFFLTEDFEKVTKEMIDIYNNANAEQISLVTLTVLGIGEDVTDSSGTTLAANQLINDEMEVMNFKSSLFNVCQYQTIEAYAKEGELLTLIDIVNRNTTLKNVFFLGEDENQVGYFYHDFEIRYRRADFSENQEVNLTDDITIGDLVKEQLADLHFHNGRLREMIFKNDVISGKLLAVSDENITLEGHGVIDTGEDIQVYRLYEQMKTLSMSDLAIGYDFTDFVVEDGKICGALAVRKEAMEHIRVALKTENFAGLYHQEVKLTADVDYTVIYGSYSDRKTLEHSAGDALLLTSDSDLLKGGNVIITPKAGTGRITLSSLKRSQGIPTYRGSLEIQKSSDGLSIVNEVLLEEYLYSVVPSEMPASYPLEALKAQAVCARTYSYRYLQRSGLSALGAHVDDSVTYQVYNNIAENMNTTKAVKETTGQMLFFNNNPAATYYYSTSSGNATIPAIWKGGGTEDTSYLKAAIIGDDRHKLTDPVNAENIIHPDSLADDEIFTEFIRSVRESDYEINEQWYRWKYEVKDMKKDKIAENIKKRYNTNYRLVLTLEKGEYISKPIKDVGEITNIYCAKRLPGGVMDELIIETTNNTYKIISENSIRFVLNDSDYKVTRQDGSQVTSPNLVPSAFFVIEPTIKNNRVTGYHIIGGGYGHGVGMSQNGARALGNRGYNYTEILAVFYGDCEIRTD
ncbi:MAG: SpoIID/LytB domain-containing protein [Lachnospiraceae bacterium]|nr:SpoIID/LytB domain-containing protein [Lachnospiraceae bacterium]